MGLLSRYGGALTSVICKLYISYMTVWCHQLWHHFQGRGLRQIVIIWRGSQAEVLKNPYFTWFTKNSRTLSIMEQYKTKNGGWLHTVCTQVLPQRWSSPIALSPLRNFIHEDFSSQLCSMTTYRWRLGTVNQEVTAILDLTVEPSTDTSSILGLARAAMASTGGSTM